jgi:hypothetical protein
MSTNNDDQAQSSINTDQPDVVTLNSDVEQTPSALSE